MITYTDYVDLCSRHGAERTNQLFPRTIAAMWRDNEKNNRKQQQHKHDEH